MSTSPQEPIDYAAFHDEFHSGDAGEKYAQLVTDQTPLWMLPRTAALQNLRATWAQIQKELKFDFIRNRKLLGDDVIAQEALTDDDMNDFSIHLYENNAKTANAPVTSNKWIIPACIAGLALLTGIIMLPWIIDALQPHPEHPIVVPPPIAPVVPTHPIVVPPPTPTEFSPILKPGRPAGVKK